MTKDYFVGILLELREFCDNLIVRIDASKSIVELPFEHFDIGQQLVSNEICILVDAGRL